MSGIFKVMAALVLLATCSAGDEVIGTGPRPAVHVYDPTDVLTEEVERQIGEPLVRIREKELIDIVVLVLPDFGEAPPEHVARTFANAWCDPAANCIVLHVPEREGSPWIFPGGRVAQEVPQSVSGPTIEAARSRAARETGTEETVRAAATEAADLLRMWVGSNAHVEEIVAAHQQRAQKAYKEAELRKRIRVIAAVGIGLPVFLVLVSLLISGRRRRLRKFPRLHWQRRLGAPYSGGNHITHRLGSLGKS